MSFDIPSDDSQPHRNSYDSDLSEFNTQEEMRLRHSMRNREVGNAVARSFVDNNQNDMSHMVRMHPAILPPSLSSNRSYDMSSQSNNGQPSRHSVRSRSWMITYHGVDASNVDEVYMRSSITRLTNQSVHTTVTYAVWQQEISPSTGNTHVQMYIEFSQVVRVSFVQQLFSIPRNAYALPRRGSRDTCIKYCTKEETRLKGPFIIDNTNANNQGSRTDVHTIHSMIASGARSADIYTAFPNTYMRMVHGVRQAMAVVRQRDAPRDRQVRVIVLYGQTGTGKTYGIVNQPECDLYTVDSSMLQSNSGNLWWDGYEGERHVLFDEYNDWFGIAGLLKYLDRYALRIQSKGSSTVAYYNILYITSNKAPWEWKDRNGQEFNPEHKAALHRRIHTLGEVKITDKGKTRIIELQKLNGRICDKNKITNWIGEDKVEHYENVFAAAQYENQDQNQNQNQN